MTRMFIALISLLISSCGDTLCENRLTHEITSPQKTYTASIFERNCGATTPVINIVSIRNSNQSLDMENYQNWVFTAHGQSTIQTSWESDNSILISYSAFDQNPTRKLVLGDVKVIFVKKENTN